MMSYEEFLCTLRVSGVIHGYLRYYTFHDMLYFEVDNKDYESDYNTYSLYDMYRDYPHEFELVDVYKSRRYQV